MSQRYIVTLNENGDDIHYRQAEGWTFESATDAMLTFMNEGRKEVSVHNKWDRFLATPDWED